MEAFQAEGEVWTRSSLWSEFGILAFADHLHAHKTYKTHYRKGKHQKAYCIMYKASLIVLQLFYYTSS